ncbi:receptor protein kinase TMK1-like [Senna tora]|uniref:non-specific serine/threonine protein kinase n=1 Tax=Senna tora TaxID=362788 RepID=A0A834U132_9FABA|nr:receptor protein kinase TMK1-like [Senna tora]
MEKPQVSFGASFNFHRFVLVLFVANSVLSQSDDDAEVMRILKRMLNDPIGLKWTDPDVCEWQHVQCNSGKRVISIQIGNQDLHGSLPKELESLTELQRFECPKNGLTGPFPYLSKSLQRLLIHSNAFTSIPLDFFKGMTILQEARIGDNPFAQWSIPESLKDCVSLETFSAENASLVGTIPEFFGSSGPFPGLVSLHLNSNSLEGGLPGSFLGSSIQELVLNGQNSKSKLNGTILVLQNMTSLRKIWLHDNAFTGPIPDLSRHDQLFELSLRDNQLACVVPISLTALPRLKVVNLTNNLLQGPTPTFKPSVSVDMSGINRFCSNVPGEPCSAIVNVLLSIVQPLGCPVKFAENWKGNDPCNGTWIGIVCSGGNISLLNFQNMGLSGTISPTYASLTSVTKLLLADNSLSGLIPRELTSMPLLQELDVSNNHLGGFVPSFREDVVLNTSGNPDIGKPLSPPPGAPTSDSSSQGSNGRKNVTAVIAGIVVGLAALVATMAIVLVKKLKLISKKVIHPRDLDDGKAIKITISNSGSGGGVFGMVIPINVLRKTTDNFSEGKILGKGGFGTVYKGALHDGTEVAVKRMEAGMVVEKGLKEFQSEIAVLTKVRHKHLVALLGYCWEGNERLLVYEYMPQGALSKYLFKWEESGLKPLTWTRRVSIALDVARGVEYLHSLAQQSFIHRDLKPSNILLGDDMRAKVSDFGLVRPAPEGKASIETRLAGTFGYLAPEYAATGRVTTKVDVYSFGVILMELITGRRVLDDSQPDEYFHLVTWFRQMAPNKDTFLNIIDPTIAVADDDAETLSSITTVSELAGHCCASDPHQRPDIGYAVSVLSPLVQAWKPSEKSDSNNDSGSGSDEFGMEDLEMSLPQALKKWQSMEERSTVVEGYGSSSSSLVIDVTNEGNDRNTQTRLRQVCISLKERGRVSYAKIASSSAAGFSDVNLILIKATTPDDAPLQEKYIHALLNLFSVSPPSSLHSFSLAFTRRFGTTRSWRVALKCLLLLHRLLRSVPDRGPFRSELLRSRSNGLLSLRPCRFRDESSPSFSMECTVFIRSYALLLDECLDCVFSGLESPEDQAENKEEREISEILEVLPQVQDLVDRVIGCAPTGGVLLPRSVVVGFAMRYIIRESFVFYAKFRRDMVVVLDNLLQMPYENCVAAFAIYKKAATQTNQLVELYDWCDAKGLCGLCDEFPLVDRIPQLQIQALENFLKGMWGELTESSSSSSATTAAVSSASVVAVGGGDMVEKEKPLIDVDEEDSWETLLESSISFSHAYGHGSGRDDEGYGRQEDASWKMQVYNKPTGYNPFC